MINTIKSLFLLVLCAGVICCGGGIANLQAQNKSDVLQAAGGKSLRQSDINQLIEFYEWAFETKFTREQRAEFGSIKEIEFRNNPAEAKKGNDSIIGFLSKIRTHDDSRQEEIRKVFVAEFVPNLRKAGGDAEAQFLVDIYAAAAAQGNAETGAKDAEGSADGVAAASGNGTGLSGLIGKWVWGRSGSTTYATGGAMLGSNGSRHTYQFSATGAVEYTGIMNVMTGGCRMQVFKSSKGRAKVTGNTLTIDWSPATFTRDDSCSPSKNYTKTLPAETETFQIKFKSDYGQKQLCLTSKDETCFSPEK